MAQKGDESSSAGGSGVIRGGSWNNNAINCRSANRNNDGPANRNNNIGFRVVRER
jgi:formylglycine-generating enzyme required for sulfatase activity